MHNGYIIQRLYVGGEVTHNAPTAKSSSTALLVLSPTPFPPCDFPPSYPSLPPALTLFSLTLFSPSLIRSSQQLFHGRHELRFPRELPAGGRRRRRQGANLAPHVQTPSYPCILSRTRFRSSPLSSHILSPGSSPVKPLTSPMSDPHTHSPSLGQDGGGGLQGFGPTGPTGLGALAMDMGATSDGPGGSGGLLGALAGLTSQGASSDGATAGGNEPLGASAAADGGASDAAGGGASHPTADNAQDTATGPAAAAAGPGADTDADGTATTTTEEVVEEGGDGAPGGPKEAAEDGHDASAAAAGAASLSPQKTSFADILRGKHQAAAAAAAAAAFGAEEAAAPEAAAPSPTGDAPPAAAPAPAPAPAAAAAASAIVLCPFAKAAMFTKDSGRALLADVMSHTRTAITVDLHGPPGLPRKVKIRSIAPTAS